MSEKTVETEVNQEAELAPKGQVVTLARALNEVKMLSKRIDKLSQERNFVQTQKGSSTAQPLDTIDFGAHIQAMTALIERRSNIKNLITSANSQVRIKVGQYEMTIAAAISMKETIPAQENVLSNALSVYKSAKGRVNQANEQANEKLSQLLEANFAKDKKADSADYEAIAGPFNKANTTVIVNEETLIKQFEDYSSFIEEFSNEVDFALSEANAQVKIELPL